MGLYKKAIITELGSALLARSIAGDLAIRFSHVSTSDYIYPDGTDFAKLTALEGVKQTVTPSDIQVTDDTLISIRAMFGNENILTPYFIQNIGVYAMDGDTEILFSVSQASTPDQMPAYNGEAPSSFLYNVQLTVSQASNIQVTVNPAGTVTIQDLLDVENKLIGKILTNVTIPLSKWNNLTYTIDNAAITQNSTVYIGYNFDSIPAAQKANIRGKTEAGRLVLAAKKLPAEDLKVDEIRILNLREG